MADREEALIKKFERLSSQAAPRPNLIKKCFFAFLIGGLFCDVGQFFNNYFLSLGISGDEVAAYVAIVMVFIGALLTGLGVYDEIANIAGAGSVVPITGFANAIVAPAMEFKKEGYIFGLAAKMFTIAGPVLVYGISASVLVGIIHYISIIFR